MCHLALIASEHCTEWNATMQSTYSLYRVVLAIGIVLGLVHPRKIFFEHNIFLTFLKTCEIFSSVADINLEKSFRPSHEFEQNSDAKQELCL